MSTHLHMNLFFVVSLLVAVAVKSKEINTRILLPAASSSPPVLSTPDDGGRPFFPEKPNNGQNQDQPPPLQPNQSSPVSSNLYPIPPQQQPRPIKKVAIAISVGIVTLGMFSALAFYIFKHRRKNPIECRKLVGPSNSLRINEESTMAPPSNFLYIGTVEPFAPSSSETNWANSSPYRKLNSIKRSDRYRPSPDLQPLPPLPPLSKPPRPNSPPAMTSSDDESYRTARHTPQFSSEGYYSTPISRSTKYTKRISRSQLSAVIIPPIKKPPDPPRPLRPLPQEPPVACNFVPKMEKLPSAPRPPPPPPPRKFGGSQTSSSSVASHQTTPESEKTIGSCSSSGSGKSGKTERSGAVEVERCDCDDIGESKPKLKPLHWDKVQAPSDRATVWDRLNSSSFQVNEDKMESLFGCNPSVNSVHKEVFTRKSVLPPVEHRILDPKKSQNIAIMLRAQNVTKEEVSEALLDGNPEGLGAELLETLMKMAPTKEEEVKLRDYKSDISKLGSAERFLKAVLDVPFAFKRVEAMLYQANFESEVNYLRNSFQTLEDASKELKNSKLFLKILEAVLRTGNRMNVGTSRGDARAFKLDTLLKLVDIKGADGKTTLLHFVVQEIIRSEGTASNLQNKTNMKLKEEDLKRQELQVVAGLSQELGNVKKAAGMDSDVQHSYVSRLETGLENLRLVLQFEENGIEGKFLDSIKVFLEASGEEMVRIKGKERRALSMVKEVTEYFHGNAAVEEAHPLRIFIIVRDFLSILDNVCKDVGKMHDRTMIGSARTFRIPTSASLPVLSKYTEHI